MAISHGFNKTEAETSVSAPVSVNSGLQVIVGTAPVNLLADPHGSGKHSAAGEHLQGGGRRSWLL